MKLLLLLLVSFKVTASPFAIYGEDNRAEPFAVTSPLLLKMADSTAAMIGRDQLTTRATETTITGKSLGDMFRLCPHERFRNQPVAASCSGTLVAPDLIMTAAHCYDMVKQNCREFSWVFDYRVSQDKQLSVTVPNSKVYKCVSVVLKEYNIKAGQDFALVKLDRPVNDRTFAKIRASDTIKVNDPVVLIGHPSGLPTKIADGGSVLSVNANSFKTNVDAFTVNSGSGIFNARTGEIEGILSSGRQDYDGNGNCSSTVKYQMEEGNETVIKPIRIQEFLKTYK